MKIRHVLVVLATAASLATPLPVAADPPLPVVSADCATCIIYGAVSGQAEYSGPGSGTGTFSGQFFGGSPADPSPHTSTVNGAFDYQMSDTCVVEMGNGKLDIDNSTVPFSFVRVGPSLIGTIDFSVLTPTWLGMMDVRVETETECPNATMTSNWLGVVHWLGPLAHSS